MPMSIVESIMAQYLPPDRKTDFVSFSDTDKMYLSNTGQRYFDALDKTIMTLFTDVEYEEFCPAHENQTSVEEYGGVEVVKGASVWSTFAARLGRLATIGSLAMLVEISSGDLLFTEHADFRSRIVGTGLRVVFATDDLAVTYFIAKNHSTQMQANAAYHQRNLARLRNGEWRGFATSAPLVIMNTPIEELIKFRIGNTIEPERQPKKKTQKKKKKTESRVDDDNDEERNDDVDDTDSEEYSRAGYLRTVTRGEEYLRKTTVSFRGRSYTSPGYLAAYKDSRTSIAVYVPNLAADDVPVLDTREKIFSNAKLALHQLQIRDYVTQENLPDVIVLDDSLRAMVPSN